MNPRIIRTVDAKVWNVAEDLGNRKKRLDMPPVPEEVVARLVDDAMGASRAGTIRLALEPCYDRPGYLRLNAQIPVSELTFDYLFNGRSGYRAQFYLSPEEGILYNRDIVLGLLPILKKPYKASACDMSWDLVQQSLIAPHSKIWIFHEKGAFDEALDDTLNPPRWVANRATRGRKAPLPSHPTIDVKGAFIRPDDLDVFVDEPKADRACDLFNRGYT